MVLTQEIAGARQFPPETPNLSALAALALRLPVKVTRRLHATHRFIGGGREVGVADAGSGSHLAGVRILNDVDGAECREAEITQVSIRGVDELVSFRAGG